MKKNHANQQEKLDDALNDILEEETEEEEYPTSQVVYSSLTQEITIDDQPYRLLVDHREGFETDALKQRYTSFFDRYDFIIGDWASDKLRLKGFYQLNPQKRGQFKQIDQLTDYLNEYINYGAPYFLMAKEEAAENYEELYQQHQAADFKLNPLPTKKASNIQTKSSRRRKQNQNKRKKQSQPSHKKHAKTEWNISSRKKKNDRRSTISSKTETKNKKQPFVIRKTRKGHSND